jgi:hypothetical protein
LRVGTLVLNAPFWNPTLLAREVAPSQVLMALPSLRTVDPGRERFGCLSCED